MIEKILIGILILIVGFLGFYFYNEDTCEKEETIITAVGGCDKYGLCGVAYKNGKDGISSHPIIGKKVMICK